MKKQFLKNKWIVSLMFLFIVCSLTSNIGAGNIGSSSVGSAWYIDDDATYPGSGSELDPFKYIWQGIENATSGDDIRIASGIYYECNYLDKKLTLNWYGKDILGDDTGRPIINGSYKSSVIEVHASDVKILNIIVVSGEKTGRSAGIYIEDSVKNVEINNCEISDCYFGIWSHRTKADKVFHKYIDNKIYDIINSGIIASLSDELDIINNTITNCGNCGILLLDCENCNINANVCEKNHNGIGVDVGRKNNIIKNTCKNNDKWGFYIVNGLLNTIKENNFIDNGGKGQATWVEDRIIGNNQWTNNYWGSKFYFIIHIIGGSYRRGDIDYPFIRFDLFPSSNPN